MRGLLITGLLLAGCTTVHESYAPDGRVAYTINCSEPLKWDRCYVEAGKLCGASGYDILDKSNGMIDANGKASSWQASGLAVNPNEHTMLISCKK